ncbi:MAG: hypothetical protein LBJ75_01095 [Puniceicoccales bacterium]|jgi:hypothetical protein|nr:hypothetical protein [Puniceicoccales bacterium]
MDKLGTTSARAAGATGSGPKAPPPPPPTFDEIMELLSPSNFESSNFKKNMPGVTFAKAKEFFNEKILPKYPELEGVPPLQLDYIGNYFASMVTEGNTVAFSMAVCLAMGILYKQGLERLLPQTIDANTILDSSGAAMRERAVGLLAGVMGNNGGNYAIIQDYLFHQQEVGSLSDSSQALKYFLHSQIREESKHSIGNRVRFFLRGLTMEQLGSKYFAKMSTCRAEMSTCRADQYIRSIVFYKAFTAIGLGNLLSVTYNGNQIPLSTDPDGKRYIEVARAVHIDTVEACKTDASCPFDAAKSEFPLGTPIGIADSASLGDPPSAWVEKPEYETHRMPVPLSNFFAAYFLSPELCREGDAATQSMVPHPTVKFSQSVRKAYRFQRELTCDMSTSSPVKVIPYQLPAPLEARHARRT